VVVSGFVRLSRRGRGCGQPVYVSSLAWIGIWLPRLRSGATLLILCRDAAYGAPGMTLFKFVSMFIGCQWR